MAKDIKNKLPKAFDLDQVRKHLGPSISPTSVVLLQELERFNKLLLRMAKSLSELQRVSRARPARLPRPAGPPWAHSARGAHGGLLVRPTGLGWRGWHEQRAG